MKHTITIAQIHPLPMRPKLSFSGSAMQVAMKYRKIFGRSDNAVHESGNVIAKLNGITLEEIALLRPATSKTTCDPGDLYSTARDIERRGHYIEEIVVPTKVGNHKAAQRPYIVWSEYPPAKSPGDIRRQRTAARQSRV